MQSPENESSAGALAAEMRRVPNKLRVCTWVSAAMMLAAAVFLRHWGNIQRVGIPGVKVVLQDVHLMPEKVEANTSYDSMKVIATNAVALPKWVLGYDSSELPVQQIVYSTLPKDTTFGQRMYVAGDGLKIQNTVVLMGTDRTSIHKPEFCLVGSGWQILKAEEVRIPMTRPVSYELPAMKMTIRQEQVVDGKKRVTEGVYVFWFVSGDKLTARHRERMWWMAKDLLTKGQLQRWAYVIAFGIGPAGETGQTDAIYDRLKSFVQASVPQYQLVPVRETKTAASE